MNILLLSDYYPPDRIGGVGTIAQGLADAYRRLGHRVVVLTTGERREVETAAGVHRTSRRLAWGVLRNNAEALRLIGRERIDLVHLHQSGTTLFLLARILRDAFPRVITSLQVSYLAEAREVRAVSVEGRRFRPRPREYVERLVLAPAHVAVDLLGYLLSDAVTVVSRDNRDEILDSYGRLEQREVHVVPNGVSAPAAVPRDAALEATAARLRDSVVITYAGVFRARKRVANLILAFARVAARCPEARLLLVGGGRGYDQPLRALVRELRLDDRVVFTGPVHPDRVAGHLALSDVFCLVSSYEGMPMVVLEAMLAGKAVVATDRWGQRDLLAGGAGVLVPVDDIPATARALEALVRDPERRRLLGDAARDRVTREYSWDRIARRYLALVPER